MTREVEGRPDQHATIRKQFTTFRINLERTKKNENQQQLALQGKKILVII